MHKFKNAFTLIELLTVLALIAILATLSVISLNRMRVRGRDLRRVTDIRTITAALEMYNGKEGRYPAADEFVIGQPIKNSSGDKTYLKAIPSNPTPRTDNGCPDQDYIYTVSDDLSSFTLGYCLSSEVGGVGAGQRTADKTGIDAECEGSCVGRCFGQTDGCGVFCPQTCAWQTFWSDTQSNISQINFAVDSQSGNIYIAYVANAVINVKKFTPGNSTPIDLGSVGSGSFLSLSVYNDTPYVAYKNSVYQSYPAQNWPDIKRYNGSTWVDFTPSSIPEPCDNIAMCIAGNGNVFFAYKNKNTSPYNIIFKRYNGSTWTTLSTPVPPYNTVEGGNNTLHLLCDGTNAYAIYRKSSTIHAVKYTTDGFGYTDIGNVSTTGSDRFSVFVFDSVPYVFYTEGSPSVHGAIKRWVSGTTWEQYPGANIETPSGGLDGLFVESNGRFHVAYVGTTNNIFAKNYSTAWNYTGSNPIFSTNVAGQETALIISQNIPYVAYLSDGNTVVIKRFVQP